MLGFLKLQLATYNMSGSDTTKWFNRWVRKLGQPPVIYDQALTEASAYQLRQALVNRGYMGTVVEIDTVRRDNKKKIDVTYHITTGEPHYISTINYNLPDSAIAGIVMSDTLSFTVKPGDLLDRNKLDEERIRITELFGALLVILGFVNILLGFGEVLDHIGDLTHDLRVALLETTHGNIPIEVLDELLLDAADLRARRILANILTHGCLLTQRASGTDPNSAPE